MKSGEPDSVDLAAHAAALAETVRTGSSVPIGRLYGLPELRDDYWVDMAGVVALTGVRPKTITSWLSRGGPIRNPFPVPNRLLYRLYWRGTEIASWQARERVGVRRLGRGPLVPLEFSAFGRDLHGLVVALVPKPGPR